jgi:hypothetical protein
MLPKRADPVAGSLLATIVLGAFLALPVLILALIVRLVVRAVRSSSSPANSEVETEFSSRFHELEEGILDASAGEGAEGSPRRRRRPGIPHLWRRSDS